MSTVANYSSVDVSDLLSRLGSVNKGYGATLEQLPVTRFTQGEWPVDKNQQYELILNRLLAEGLVVSYNSQVVNQPLQLFKLSTSRGVIPPLLNCLIAGSGSGNRFRSRANKLLSLKPLSVTDLFQLWLGEVTGRRIDSKGVNSNNYQQTDDDTNWAVFANYLDDLQALKNARLVNFEPAYMMVSATALAVLQFYQAKSAKKSSLSAKLYARLQLKDSIEKLGYEMMAANSSILVSHFKQQLVMALPQNLLNSSAVSHNQVDSMINKVIKKLISAAVITASQSKLVEQTNLSRQNFYEVNEADVNIITEIYCRSVAKPATYGDIVRQLISHGPGYITNRQLAFANFNLVITLSHLQHLFQTGLLQEVTDYLVPTDKTKAILADNKVVTVANIVIPKGSECVYIDSSDSNLSFVNEVDFYEECHVAYSDTPFWNLTDFVQKYLYYTGYYYYMRCYITNGQNLEYAIRLDTNMQDFVIFNIKGQGQHKMPAGACQHYTNQVHMGYTVVDLREGDSDWYNNMENYFDYNFRFFVSNFPFEDLTHKWTLVVAAIPKEIVPWYKFNFVIDWTNSGLWNIENVTASADHKPKSAEHDRLPAVITNRSLYPTVPAGLQ